MPHNTRKAFARIASGEPYILDLGRFIDENPLAIVPRTETDRPVAGSDDHEAAETLGFIRIDPRPIPEQLGDARGEPQGLPDTYPLVGGGAGRGIVKGTDDEGQSELAALPEELGVDEANIRGVSNAAILSASTDDVEDEKPWLLANIGIQIALTILKLARQGSAGAKSLSRGLERLPKREVLRRLDDFLENEGGTLQSARKTAKLVQELRRLSTDAKRQQESDDRTNVASRLPTDSPPEQRFVTGAVRPVSELQEYYELHVQGATNFDPDLPAPYFEIGELPDWAVSEAAQLVRNFGRVSSTTRISGLNVLGTELARRKLTPNIIENIESIVLNPQKVLPNPKDPNPIQLIGPPVGPTKSYVSVVEAAVRERWLDVLSIHSSPQRTIRNAELLKAQMLGTNQGL